MIPPNLNELIQSITNQGPLTSHKGLGLGWVLHYVREIGRRRRFIKEYSWSVPTPTAIAAIAELIDNRRLLEIGAGSGLWSSLLNATGISVTATDDYSWTALMNEKKQRLPSGFTVPAGRFFPVEQLDGPTAVRKYPEHQALLVCWPPPDRSWAFQALACFQGDQVVFIGDKGCTADEAFYAELATGWQQHHEISIPTWPGIHDAIYLYERKIWRGPTASPDQTRHPYLTKME